MKRRLLLSTLLVGLAGCAGGAFSSDDEDLAPGAGRSSCPDSTWTDFVLVEPESIAAGSAEELLLSWEVYVQAQAPLEVELTARAGGTTMVVTLPLEAQGSSSDTLRYEARTLSPFGSILAGTDVDVLFRGARPRGCPRGPEASTTLPLTGP